MSFSPQALLAIEVESNPVIDCGSQVAATQLAALNLNKVPEFDLEA